MDTIDHRSFPDAADGRPMPPMGYALMEAGLSGSDAAYAARQLRGQGYYLVRSEDLGWDDIRRFQCELHKGQDIREDGGGYFVRCIMVLFGKESDPVETYQQAAEKMLRDANLAE